MKLFWQRFKFLGIAILALFIFIPLLVFSSPISFNFPGYQTKIFDLSSIGRGSVCMINNSANNYFVPAKTASEWDAFSSAALSRLNISIPSPCCGDGVCSGAETPSSCWIDCASKCDYQPAGIYSSAIYSNNTNCGGTPLCLLNYAPAQYVAPPYGTSPSPLPQVFGNQENGGCGILKIQRSSKCASLLKTKDYICNGDPCINAVYVNDYQTVSFCTGVYDSLANTCVYQGMTTRSVGWIGSGAGSYLNYQTMYPDGSKTTNTPFYNNGAVGTWGTCGTVVPCGDGICSSGYGEGCGTCSLDCGSCAYIDCYSNRDCSNNYCEGLSAYCSGSYGCENNYDEDSCNYAGCYWNVSSPGYCPGFSI